MKKVGWIHSFHEDELKDLLTETQGTLVTQYDYILNAGLEQYLRMPLNLSLDKIECISVQGTNDSFYIVNGKLIGKMSQNVGYENDDFIRNHISIKITFTPIIGETEQCPKCKHNSLHWETCLGPECLICKWHPNSIPWNEENI